jgi:hypothetical protein
MKIDRTVSFLCLAALSVPFAYGSSEPFGSSTDPNKTTDPNKPPAVSSSSSLPDAPDSEAIEEAVRTESRNALRTNLRLETKPFSAFAIGFTASIGGLGIDVATPLGSKVNLRASASYLNYSPLITEDGIPIDAAVRLRTICVGVDLFPYHNTFHITPGITMYNGNHMGAVTNIAGGAMFSVNDTTYESAPGDPVHGTFDVYLGHKVAPSFTVGFGNMLRRDSHWSVPVDFGFQYIGTPKFTLIMNGSVCTPQDGCTRIQDDPDTLANLAQEQATVNREISILRFYPILKVGLSYRFGRNAKLEYWR